MQTKFLQILLVTAALTSSNAVHAMEASGGGKEEDQPHTQKIGKDLWSRKQPVLAEELRKAEKILVAACHAAFPGGSAQEVLQEVKENYREAAKDELRGLVDGGALCGTNNSISAYTNGVTAIPIRQIELLNARGRLKVALTALRRLSEEADTWFPTKENTGEEKYGNLPAPLEQLSVATAAYFKLLEELAKGDAQHTESKKKNVRNLFD